VPQLFVNTGRALFTFGVIAASTPIVMVVIIPLGFVYIVYQKYYLRTSRELKRLDSVSRSPIYAHFQESLGGVSTIRAYRQQARFTLENEWRMDANLRAYFPSVSANRWLAVRLEFIGSVIILSAAVFAVISVTTGSGLSAGMVGLAVRGTVSTCVSACMCLSDISAHFTTTQPQTLFLYRLGTNFCEPRCPTPSKSPNP
jgi:ATP-binding cassette, subfamily C (CFTR/MRP), member 1